MAATSRYTGHALTVLWQSGGSTYILSGDQTSMDFSDDMNTADLTAGDDDFSFEKATYRQLSATINAHFIGTAGTATYGMIQPGSEGTLVFGPEGTAVGKPKGGFPAIIKGKSFSVPYDGAVTRTLTIGSQGGVFGTSVYDPDKHTF